MERAFENQKYIKVSLARVYNGSLVLKTEEKSLSKIGIFFVFFVPEEKIKSHNRKQSHISPIIFET